MNRCTFKRFLWGFQCGAIAAGMLVMVPGGALGTLPRSPIHLAQQSGDAPDGAAETLFKQGLRQFQQRQWQAAEASWQQAVERYRQVGDRRQEGRVLGNLAAIQEAQGKNAEALALFQQSLAVARQIQDATGESFALTNLGYLYKNLGQYPQAIAHLNAALPIAKTLADREGEFTILNQLGIINRVSGNYEEAIALFQQSLPLARSLGSVAGEANILGNLGNTYTDQGNYPAALADYQQALPLMQQSNNPVGKAGILQRLGTLYLQLGNRTRAKEYLTQSLTLARSLGDRRVEAYILGNLGTVSYESESPQQALGYLRQALTLMQQLGDRAAQGQLLHKLGNAYQALGNLVTATTYYQQSLDISRQVGDRAGEGIALGSLAIVLDQQQQKPQAIARYREALAVVRQVGDRPNEGRALSNLGMALFDIGQLEESAKTLLAAIAIWDSLRPGLADSDQVSLFETQAATYRTLQQVLIRLNRDRQALEISERGRARAFVDLVARRLSVQAATRLQTAPLAIADIQKIAQQQNATLVEYAILGKAELAIWVIQPTGAIHFRHVTVPSQALSITETAEQTRVATAIGRGRSIDDSLSRAIAATRSALVADKTAQASAPPTATPPTAAPSPRRLSRNLRSLHQWLIEPISNLLPSDPNQQVVFIPQGTLLLVPFAALQAADLTYLIEQHTLRTAPAIQVLGLTHTLQAQRSTLPKSAIAPGNNPGTDLIIGNPTMPRVGQPPEPLSALPFAEQEAREIAALLKTTAFVGNQATEATVTQRLPNARRIHFATHGLLDDVEGVGIPGALALAPTSTTDGLLTASEILGLSLNQAELVVLSACDTGRGRITGDGVIGLSRSLISAGAPSVIVSLWAVPDDSTAALMTAFYQTLAIKPGKAQAMRQAMLKTLQQYPSPRDWAAFTLIGESD